MRKQVLERVFASDREDVVNLQTRIDLMAADGYFVSQMAAVGEYMWVLFTEAPSGKAS